jgi:hypothetical protein
MLPYAVIPLAFLCGSLPFSVWVGKILLDLDVRKYGDGNPGAANAFRTGNKLVGLLVLLLDISKAADSDRTDPRTCILPLSPFPGRKSSCHRAGRMDRINDLEALSSRYSWSIDWDCTFYTPGLVGHACTEWNPGGYLDLDARSTPLCRLAF